MADIEGPNNKIYIDEKDTELFFFTELLFKLERNKD